MSRTPNVADLLAEVFKRGGLRRGVKRAEAVLLWPQVVGPKVAKFTEARTLQDGVLFVEVPDSETAMHLSFQRQKFLNVYHAKFGVKEVREVRFRAGRRRPEEKPPPPPLEAQPDPKALAHVARHLSQAALPDLLTQNAMRAAKAMLVWRAGRLAEGWVPCTVCGSLTPQVGLCTTCERYAQAPKVARASRALALSPSQPTPLLSDEEREVAVFLAKAYLEETLQELLPQVLADPALKPHLASAARCFLAHTLGKPLGEVREDDLDRLDPRVARALGRWR